MNNVHFFTRRGPDLWVSLSLSMQEDEVRLNSRLQLDDQAANIAVDIPFDAVNNLIQLLTMAKHARVLEVDTNQLYLYHNGVIGAYKGEEFYALWPSAKRIGSLDKKMLVLWPAVET